MSESRTGGTSRSCSLIVPWRAGDPRREEIWDWCKRFWAVHYPELELIEVDDGQEPFSRGGSRNLGAEMAKGDILVFADADTLVGHVHGAIELAEKGWWCFAYPAGMYCALTEEATDKLLTTDPGEHLMEPVQEQCRQRITSYGGVLVVPREAFDAAGGYDPRFVGYGFEDNAIMFALDTMWKPHERATGWATAFEHPHIEEERFQQPHIHENKALCERYEAVYSNRSAMRALIRERQ